MHVRSRRALTAAATILAAVGLAAPAASHGAAYEIQQCHSQSNHVVSGVTGAAAGSFATYHDVCPSGSRVLGGTFSSGLEYQNGHHATTTFAAPPGTSLEYLTGQRDARAGSYRPYGTPVAHMFLTPGGVIEAFNSLPGTASSANGFLAVGLRNAQAVSWGATCSGEAGCPAGDTHYLLSQVAIGIQDSHVPQLSHVGGALRSESSRTRNRALTFQASDAGGGVYRQRLIIDGIEQNPQTVDGNGGKCAAPFSNPVPCRTEVSGSISLDTATLADGTHELALDVRDATDDNKVVHGPWSVVVDNAPPGVDMPTLAGTARDGDTVTCSANVDGQEAAVSFQWLRTATDGSNATEIVGATNAAYTIGPPDVGGKLVCRVTATDGGGATSRSTAITQPPFDAGRTVAPFCTDRPTGSGDDCGDLDGDRIPNREDDDIDGDGVPNVGDSAPYDPTRPASDSPTGGPNNGAGSGSTQTSSNTSTTTNTNSTTASQTAAVGVPELGAAGTVKFLLGRDSAVFLGRHARWHRSAFTLRGRLTGVDGGAIVGLNLHVTQTVRGRSVALGSAVTGAGGSWSFRVPRGPARNITVTAGAGVNAATLTVRQRVVAQVTLRAERKRIGRGGLAQFSGRLQGGYTNAREKLVEFQVYYRGNWRTIATLRVNRQGRFTVKYRFGTAAYGRYKFRARSMPTDGYPFAVGTSSTKASTVRVS